MHICGAKVTLISSQTSDTPYKQITVKDSKEFKEIVTKNLENTDIFLHTAKVLPYTVTENGNLTFTLQKTEDIFNVFLQNKKPQQIFKSLNESDFKDKTPQEIALQALDTLLK